MPTNAESRKAARARRRAERQATRERRRDKRDAASVAASLTATPDDPPEASSDPGRTIVTMPGEELRRRRTFKVLERTHSELVVVREAVALALFGAAPGTDEHTDLTRRVEAVNDEIDDLRELSDELLRQVRPLALEGEQLVGLERVLTDAQALRDASQRADALLGAAQQLLATLDDALDKD